MSLYPELGNINISRKHILQLYQKVLESFLETKGGTAAFTFQAPGESEVKVICKNWDVSTVHHTGVNSTSIGTLTATFERVYE